MSRYHRCDHRSDQQCEECAQDQVDYEREAERARYRTIVADPPWDVKAGPEFGSNGPSRNLTYPTMSVQEIAALPVRALSDNLDSDAHLYLWTINAYLRNSFDVCRVWGFHPAQTIVWAKSTIGTGLGGIWPSNVEFCIFARRPKAVSRPEVLRVTTYLADAAERAGYSRRQLDEAMATSDMAGWWLSRIEHRCACPSFEQYKRIKWLLDAGDDMDTLVRELNAAKGIAERQTLNRADSSWFQWKRAEHSAKPDAFLDIVEQVSPGPYLELFARRQRLGWDTWGNEALEHVQVSS